MTSPREALWNSEREWHNLLQRRVENKEIPWQEALELARHRALIKLSFKNPDYERDYKEAVAAKVYERLAKEAPQFGHAPPKPEGTPYDRYWTPKTAV